MASEKENRHSENSNQVKPYEVTVEGSLGLLALGAQGIKAWRKKKAEESAKSGNKSKDE